MTFRSTITAIKEAFHLNPNYFGETVTYTPYGGTPRTINVHIYETEELEIMDVDTEDRRRIIKVKAMKDPVKGIPTPCLGDTILRSVQHDADQRPYTYQGEHEFECVDSWRLHFSRRRRDAQGVKGGK